MRSSKNGCLHSCSIVLVAILSCCLAELARAGETSTNKKPEISVDIGEGVKIELVLIPAGNFMDLGRQVDVQSFYLGKYEITQEQWQTVMGTGPLVNLGPHYPVAGMTWKECETFIDKLNAKTGKHFVFPTSEQWSYAAKAGKDTFDAMKPRVDDLAWHRGNSGNAVHPVGQKKPNDWGLYDILGNVNELTVNAGSFRMHGGSFAQNVEECWGWSEITYSLSNLGLRLALPIGDTE
jgi:hypothetical protein